MKRSFKFVGSRSLLEQVMSEKCVGEKLAHDMTNKSARQGVTGRDSVEYQSLLVNVGKIYYILVC